MTDQRKVIKLFPDDASVRDRHSRLADYYAAQVAKSTNKTEAINKCIVHMLKSLGAQT